MWVHQVKTPIAALRLLLQNKNDEGQMTEELSELFGIEQYVEMALQYQRLDSREFDTLKSKKVPQSLEIGLFFCQIFIFII